MHIVDTIFDTLGEATAIATETGDPVQTVHSWKAKGNIPHWRRQAVIEAAKKLNKPLAPDALEYLASTDRAPKREEPLRAARAA
jgi:hypothetical protein